MTSITPTKVEWVYFNGLPNKPIPVSLLKLMPEIYEQYKLLKVFKDYVAMDHHGQYITLNVNENSTTWSKILDFLLDRETYKFPVALRKRLDVFRISYTWADLYFDDIEPYKWFTITEPFVELFRDKLYIAKNGLKIQVCPRSASLCSSIFFNRASKTIMVSLLAEVDFEDQIPITAKNYELGAILDALEEASISSQSVCSTCGHHK